MLGGLRPWPRPRVGPVFKGKHLESVCCIGVRVAVGLPGEVAGGLMGLPKEMGCWERFGCEREAALLLPLDLSHDTSLSSF